MLAEGISTKQFDQAVDSLNELFGALGIDAIDHLRAALSMTGQAVEHQNADNLLDSITLVTGANANLDYIGNGDFPEMFRGSVTAIKLEKLRDSIKTANGLLLRERSGDAVKLLNSSLRDFQGIMETYQRESDFSALVLPGAS
ncbi:MAG: hypothetical protein KDD70_09320 [Bdellovibrionales bacterium]|nr:hypothetical protein [Bdellovibrionales bacterium]